MAKLNLNPLLASIQGHIGDLVFVHEGGHVSVRAKAKTKPKERSSAQVAPNVRFAAASRWARTLPVDPAVVALYQAACHDHLIPHNLAVRDFLHAPAITALDLDSDTGRAGDTIRILGADDFKIVRVEGSILTVDRYVLEEGEAEWDQAAGCWEYAGRTLVPEETTVLIEAAAVDLPGNRSTAKAYDYVEPNPINPTGPDSGTKP